MECTRDTDESFSSDISENKCDSYMQRTKLYLSERTLELVILIIFVRVCLFLC
jgi:hypothetical protein